MGVATCLSGSRSADASAGRSMGGKAVLRAFLKKTPELASALQAEKPVILLTGTANRNGEFEPNTGMASHKLRIRKDWG